MLPVLLFVLVPYLVTEYPKESIRNKDLSGHSRLVVARANFLERTGDKKLRMMVDVDEQGLVIQRKQLD